MAYVSFPGTSGNYVYTSSVNLLDADTAHAQQSVGDWDDNGSTQTLVSGGMTPTLGSYVIQEELSGATTQISRTNAGTSGFPVSSSTEYTFSMDTSIDTADMYYDITLRWYDSGGTSVGSSNTGWTAYPTTKTRVSHTATSHGSAAYCRIQLGTASSDAGANPAGTETQWRDAACLVEGPSTSFVPSLRIVGDFDFEAKFSMPDATPASRADLFDNGYGVSNDGYRFTVETSGELGFWFWGTTGAVGEASSGFSNSNDAVVVARVTADVSSGNVTWYKNGTQFDTDTFTAQTPVPSGNRLAIGASYAGVAELFTGDLYYVIVRDGIGGPAVCRFDAADAR